MSSEYLAVSTAATSLVTTAETAVLTFTVPPENQNPATGLGLYINVDVIVTTGAAATQLTVRVRQGTGTGGTIVGVPSASSCLASTANQGASVAANDPQDFYPQGNTYTVTVQQTAATGNGTMQYAIASVTPATAGNG